MSIVPAPSKIIHKDDPLSAAFVRCAAEALPSFRAPKETRAGKGICNLLAPAFRSSPTPVLPLAVSGPDDMTGVCSACELKERGKLTNCLFPFGANFGFGLENISKLYPDLAYSADVVDKEFLLRFRPSLEEMDKRMQEVEALDWGAIKQNYSRTISAEAQQIRWTRPDALTFLETVRERAKGDIPSPAIETLLMFHPRYQNSPVSEFGDGIKHRFEHDGSGKAKGVEFSISVPRSWKALDAHRPNIAAKFGSENGRGGDYFMILIHHIDVAPGEEITASDVEEILNLVDMAEFLPPAANYIDSGPLTLEKLPGYWVRFTQQESRVRTTFYLNGIMYVFFYGDKMIQLYASVNGLASEKEKLDRRFTKFEPLFDVIANSFVLPQIYK